MNKKIKQNTENKKNDNFFLTILITTMWWQKHIHTWSRTKNMISKIKLHINADTKFPTKYQPKYFINAMYGSTVFEYIWYYSWFTSTSINCSRKHKHRRNQFRNKCCKLQQSTAQPLTQSIAQSTNVASLQRSKHEVV